jgi:hypothetical protein
LFFFCFGPSFLWVSIHLPTPTCHTLHR